MLLIGIILAMVILFVLIGEIRYQKLETEVLEKLGFSDWDVVPYFDKRVVVKSRRTLEKYDDVKFFKEHKDLLPEAENILKEKKKIEKTLKDFLKDNEYQSHSQYKSLAKQINNVLVKAEAFRIKVSYITSAGNNLEEKEISLDKFSLEKFRKDPSLLMGKGEYNKYLREQQKEELNNKHHQYYDDVNTIIDYANTNINNLVIKGSKEKIDSLIGQLFDRTVNSIKKIKTIDSEEWTIIGDFINYISNEVKKVVENNKIILDYYESSDFMKIKETCDVLMSSQREFNEYINEKVQSISALFGSRVVRNETVNEDEYNYIRPYRKTITPFTAEVSATVFASAENNPLEYVVKNFYPNKQFYPEQIQKLHLLIEELETLKEAKQIIDNYKVEYQQYLGDVPKFVLDNDESGFYSRLGFANIDESVLTIEYKFVYTSNGVLAQRYFTVPMTEANIIELIKTLEGKLTVKAFVKEQRNLMTKKLREFIKSRDNYTCCQCGNSIHKEPNLLLEIDHIVPVTKGGYTIEDNLQTLCWKCNRAKSNKIITQ